MYNEQFLAVRDMKTGRALWFAEGNKWTDNRKQAKSIREADDRTLRDATAALANYAGEWSSIGIQLIDNV